MSALRNPLAPRWDPDRAYEDALWASPFTGTRISHGDTDFEVERNGQWLVIEGKRYGEEMSMGQRLTNEERVRQGRTVLFIYGDPPTGIVAMQHYPGPIRDATWADVWQFERSWFVWANKQAKPSPAFCAFQEAS